MDGLATAVLLAFYLYLLLGKKVRSVGAYWIGWALLFVLFLMPLATMSDWMQENAEIGCSDLRPAEIWLTFSIVGRVLVLALGIWLFVAVGILRRKILPFRHDALFAMDERWGGLAMMDMSGQDLEIAKTRRTI